MSGVLIWNKTKSLHTLLYSMLQANQNLIKDVDSVNTLGHLEKMLLAGEITEEEYRERKATYVETILELYVNGIISKEQMQERLNQ